MSKNPPLKVKTVTKSIHNKRLPLLKFLCNLPQKSSLFNFFIEPNLRSYVVDRTQVTVALIENQNSFYTHDYWISAHCQGQPVQIWLLDLRVQICEKSKLCHTDKHNGGRST